MTKEWSRAEYRKEIREKLKGLSKEQQVAFALRCALRSLPMLVAEEREEPFGYWEEDKRLEHLRALEKALDGVAGYLLRNTASAYASASDAAYAAASNAAYAAASNAYAASAAAAYASAASNAAYASAASNAASALASDAANALAAYVGNRNMFLEAIVVDIADLQKEKAFDAIVWLQRPLWGEVKPKVALKEWLAWGERLNAALADKKVEFAAWKEYGWENAFVPEEQAEVSDKIGGTTPDKPELNVKPHAQVLARVVHKLTNEAGDMVAVFGQWGRGKTFFWKQLKEQNEIKEAFVCCEFQAWKYQSTPAIWGYLYENLYEQFNPMPESRWDVKGCVKRLCVQLSLKLQDIKASWQFWGLLFLLIFGMVVMAFNKFSPELYFILGGASALWAAVELYRKRFSRQLRQLKQLSERTSFEKQLGTQAEVQKALVYLLNLWTQKEKGKRILLFVDDLDRCEEEKLLQIIEALKVIADDEKIGNKLLVVCAIDERILMQVIVNKFRKMVSAEDEQTLQLLAREQMDKLFVLALKLPPMLAEEHRLILKAFTPDEVIRPKEKPSDVNKEGGKSEERNDDNPPVPAPVYESVDTTPEEEYQEQYPKEDKYQMEQKEWEALDEMVVLLRDATPRSIRIFKLRFLLAIRLRRAERKEDFEPKLLSAWIAYYGSCIASHKQKPFMEECHKELAKRVSDEAFTLEINKIEESKAILSAQEWREFLRLLDMVVPY